MIRWREQHGPGGEHCSVGGMCWKLPLATQCQIHNHLHPLPYTSLKIWLLSNIIYITSENDLCINYDLFQLLYLVVASYPGSWLIKSLGMRLLLLGAGNTFLMSDQLWHSTPFPHSAPVITRELYIPRDEGNTKMKLHIMKPRHHSLSSSSTDKATCFVSPDSERASPPAIEQCTS